MAQLLGRKLHCLYGPRQPPPALVYKLLKSPDLRLTSQRWLAEDALLDQGISETDTDGGSNAASQDESIADMLKGLRKWQNSQALRSPNPSSKSLDNHLESSLGRLTSLVSANGEALPIEKDYIDRTQFNQSTEKSRNSANDDWQQMVSSIRSVALKKKLKGLQTNTNNAEGSLKAEQSKSQLDFDDSDLSQSRGQSSNEPFAAIASSVNNAPSQSTKQQNTKDTRWHDLSKEMFFKHKGKPSQEAFWQKGKGMKATDRQPNKEGLFDGTEAWSDSLEASRPEDSSSQIKNQLRNKDIMPSITSHECHFTSASEDGGFQNVHHLAIKNRAQNPDSSQTTRTLASRLKWAESHQTSNNNDGISKQIYMVCVQNLPPTSNPSTLKASMAMHGEVVGFFKKRVLNKLNVYIQFKTAMGMENALAYRTLRVGRNTCYIVKADNSVLTTVVRVSRIVNDIDEQQIWTVCEQYGKVDDIKKRAHGIFDVFYDAKELSNIPSILGSLSEVTLNRSTWFALPAPLLHPSVQKELLKSPEGRSWHDMQVNQVIHRIESGLDAVSVLFQDLKEINTVAREYSK